MGREQKEQGQAVVGDQEDKVQTREETSADGAGEGGEDEGRTEDEMESGPEEIDEHADEEPDGDQADQYADDEPDGDQAEAYADEIEALRQRISELEAALEACRERTELSPAARWAVWILGTLVGVVTLVLIVVFLGGGWAPGECRCDESSGLGQEEQEEAVSGLLRRNSGDFQECFEQWAGAHPSELRPGWSVTVRLDVEADERGRVSSVHASGEGLPQPLGRCLEERVARWTFPGPGPFTLELPFAVESDAPAGESGSSAESPSSSSDQTSTNGLPDGGSTSEVGPGAAEAGSHH